MKSFHYTIRIHPPTPSSPGYWVEVPALPGCFTQGDTYAQAVENAHEAIEGFIEALAKAGQPIPEEVPPRSELLDTVRVEAEVAA
jgi:antitoxin HicB